MSVDDRPDSEANLDRLRDIAEAATPGPWRHVTDRGVGHDDGNRWPYYVIWPFDGHYGGTDRNEDARFVASFDPPTVIALIDEVERLRTAIAEHRDYTQCDGSFGTDADDVLWSVLGGGE